LHISAVDAQSRLVKCVELIGWCCFNERVILCVVFSRKLRVVWNRKCSSHIHVPCLKVIQGHRRYESAYEIDSNNKTVLL